MPSHTDHSEARSQVATIQPAGCIASWRHVPGLVHGFERRPADMDPGAETREQSRRRWRAALATDGALHLLTQVHGAMVRRAPWAGLPEGDAALTDEPGLLLGIETADCLPVLLIDIERRQAAAAHAGWRGTVAGVARAALEALLSSGSRPEHVHAALGPAIGPCCYEVGDELRAPFAAAFGATSEAFFHPHHGRRPHLDVRAANQQQLVAAGVVPANIQHVDECTRCRADLYPSYRRDGAQAGRMLSWVGWRASR